MVISHLSSLRTLLSPHSAACFITEIERPEGNFHRPWWLWLTTRCTGSGYYTSLVGVSEQSEVSSSVVGWWVLALLFHSKTLQWLPLSSQALALPHSATPHSHTNLLYPHRKPGETFSLPRTILYSWHNYGNAPLKLTPLVSLLWLSPSSSEFTLTREGFTHTTLWE